MSFREVDNRIRALIENCVALGHRSMFVIVGKNGRDQIVILHHILSKSKNKTRPSVLWCYKDIGFSIHKKKILRQLKKRLQKDPSLLNMDNAFEMFLASADINFCHYGDTRTILGQTYGMVILQDFASLTPNILAHTIETVEGGGIVIILLSKTSTLKELYSLPMDAHARYKTESHQDIVCRFNERFVLSLSSCPSCLVVNDELKVLNEFPQTSHIEPPVQSPVDDSCSEANKELQALQVSVSNIKPLDTLINLCRTVDQTKAVIKFINVLKSKTMKSVVALTSARGRGKSAALGLALAGAIACHFTNICVTSPSPENLKTVFAFLFEGLNALGYEHHHHYQVIEESSENGVKNVVKVVVTQEHRQLVQYIRPSEAKTLGQAELVVIDEAAAIPLPVVKSLLSPYIVFLSSTVNGYEGTGRSLSLKLLSQLRQEVADSGNTSGRGFAKFVNKTNDGTEFHELTLNESIRYRNGDAIETWLNKLLCLDAVIIPYLSSSSPTPDQCKLYYVNRDTLFSHHNAAEEFLQRLVSLFVTSHYKNTPNDLLMMADNPAHLLFCLLPPVEPSTKNLPEILCVLQVSLEGQLTVGNVKQEWAKGKRSAGDLIPWIVSQQFQDEEFASLSGIRIVRIATHPSYQKMGYGRQAMILLQEYFKGNIYKEESSLSVDSQNEKHISDSDSLTNYIEPRKFLPPLLLKLSERRPEKVDHIGVSFGLTADLLKFWKRVGFVPVYLRQTANEVTGEHSCVMLRMLTDENTKTSRTLSEYWTDFQRRFISLLSSSFRNFSSSLALSILSNNNVETISPKGLSKKKLNLFLTCHDIKRLEMYCQNLVDYHMITDLVPIAVRLYFLQHLTNMHLSQAHAAVVLCLGLQSKTVEQISCELCLDGSEVLGLFNRSIRKITNHLKSIMEQKKNDANDFHMQNAERMPNTELVETNTKLIRKRELKHAANDQTFCNQSCTATSNDQKTGINFNSNELCIKNSEEVVPLKKIKKKKK